jgi:hypothetical protein
MQVRIAIALAGMLAASSVGISADAPPFEATLKGLVGKDVRPVMDRIGGPPPEGHLSGNVVEYGWGVYNAHGAGFGHPTTCELTLTADVRTHRIVRYSFKETSGGCAEWQRELASL